MSLPFYHFFACVNTRPPGHPKGSCGASNCGAVFEKILGKIEEKNLWSKVKLTQTGCLGPCELGPVIVVYPEGIWYGKVTPDDIEEIMEQHVGKGEPVKRLQFDMGI